jgi:hypothetical protein
MSLVGNDSCRQASACEEEKPALLPKNFVGRVFASGSRSPMLFPPCFG